jgi:hypothetical protein
MSVFCMHTFDMVTMMLAWWPDKVCVSDRLERTVLKDLLAVIICAAAPVSVSQNVSKFPGSREQYYQ